MTGKVKREKQIRNMRKLRIREFFSLVTLLNAIFILYYALSPNRTFEEHVFLGVYWLVTGAFFVEYVWNIVQAPRKLAYIFSFAGMIQVLSIIPTRIMGLMTAQLIKVMISMDVYEEFFTQGNTNTVNKLELQLFRTIKENKILLIRSLFSVLVLMVASAFVIFSFENVAQPGVFATVFDAVWWAFQTGSTVGYGDTVPITVQGRMVAMALSIVGIATFSIPTTIISTSFIQRSRNQQVAEAIRKEFAHIRHEQQLFGQVNALAVLAKLKETEELSEAEFERLKTMIMNVNTALPQEKHVK